MNNYFKQERQQTHAPAAPRRANKFTRTLRVQQSLNCVNYKDILSPRPRQRPLKDQKGVSNKWVKNYLPAKERAEHQEQYNKSRILHLGEYKDRLRPFLRTTFMQFNLTHKLQSEATIQQVKRNSILDLACSKHNYSLDYDIRPRVQGHGRFIFGQRKEVPPSHVPSDYIGGFEQLGELSRVREREKQQKDQFVSTTMHDSFGRRVKISDSLRTVEAYQKLGISRDKAQDTLQLKFYKKSMLKMQSGLLQHSQDYRSLQIKNTFRFNEPKLYPKEFQDSFLQQEQSLPRIEFDNTARQTQPKGLALKSFRQGQSFRSQGKFKLLDSYFQD